jgi:hypothetical protein
MKKLFISVAFLFATLLSHAQITLEHTLTDLQDGISLYNFGSNVEVFPIVEPFYPIVIGEDYLILTELANDGNAEYDPTVFTNVYNLNDYLLEFSVNVEQTFGRNTYDGPYLIAQNVFTTDSKFIYICRTVTEVGYYGDPRKGEIKVISQDGNILASMPYTCNIKEHGNNQSFCYLVKVGGRYKLVVENNQDDDGRYDYDIYALPGNGEATAINEVHAPRRNARKYIHDAQVLIENEKNIYTIQGQEIK